MALHTPGVMATEAEMLHTFAALNVPACEDCYLFDKNKNKKAEQGEDCNRSPPRLVC